MGAYLKIIQWVINDLFYQKMTRQKVNKPLLQTTCKSFLSFHCLYEIDFPPSYLFVALDTHLVITFNILTYIVEVSKLDVEIYSRFLIICLKIIIWTNLKGININVYNELVVRKFLFLSYICLIFNFTFDKASRGIQILCFTCLADMTLTFAYITFDHSM